MIVPLNELIADYLLSAANLAEGEGRPDSAADLRRGAARLLEEAREKDISTSGRSSLGMRAEVIWNRVAR